MNNDPEATSLKWTIADRLRKARGFTGLDQKAFAKLTGISRGTVNNYESGKGPYRRPYILTWAYYTGVSLEWLLTGEEVPLKKPRVGRARRETA